MADAVLNPSGGLFPAGTIVSAYDPWQKMLGRAPSGSPVATALVSDQGTLTFTGLQEDTAYTAYALVGTIHRYIDFRTDAPTVAPGDVDLDPVYADLAALSTRLTAVETVGVTFPDASTSAKGAAKLSSSPVDAANPIAVGDNDARLAGIGGAAVVFSTFTAGSASSGPFTLPHDATITRVRLFTTTAPVGSALIVEFRRNGVVFATLTIPDGSTTEQSLVTSRTAVTGDKLTVQATSTGLTSPATGVVAQMDIG